MTRVYEPSELFFDVAYDSFEEMAIVYVVDKETESHDSLDDGQVNGLPAYLFNQMENEWAPDYSRNMSVEDIMRDMIAAGFEHQKMIDWLD
jgi:hypothetical protein